MPIKTNAKKASKVILIRCGEHAYYNIKLSPASISELVGMHSLVNVFKDKLIKWINWEGIKTKMGNYALLDKFTISALMRVSANC